MTDLLSGRYEFRTRRISKGGVGAVGRGHDRLLHGDVALKMLQT